MAEMTSLPTRGEVIARTKQRGGRVAAIFPIHYPRALLRAFDILPVEVWGPPGVEPSPADKHLQGYTCSVVRCGLAFLLEGGLAAADVIVVPHACDSLQGLGSVLLDFLPQPQPVLPLYLPRDGAAGARDFLAAELRTLCSRLAELTGREPSDDELRAAIAREERADGLCAALLAARSRLRLSSRDFYVRLRSRQYLPAEEFIAVAEATLAEQQDAADSVPRDASTGVLLSGIVPEPMSVLDVIDDAGGMVVGDDLACTGRRLYPPGTAEEPFTRMAERLLGAAPDAMRGSPIAACVQRLGQLSTASGARTVVFYSVKFCEPEAFYLPLLRAALDAQGLRSLALEIDLSEPLPDQIVTRIEALLETVA